MDLTPQTIQFFSTLGVGGVLGFGMFLFYRQEKQQHMEELRQNADNWKGQSAMLVQVVKENTAAIAALTAHLDRVLELVKGRE